MRPVRDWRVLFPLACALLLSTFCSPGQAKEPADDDIAAIEYLGTVDCYWYPDAQTVLLDVLAGDPREEVRHAAVIALTEQLQRGKPPLDPLLGWRQIPDPLILTQIARIGTLRKPLTKEELVERYSQRKFEKEQKKGRRRGDTYRGCCTDEAIKGLARAAFDRDEAGCYVEPSERIRLAAERALRLCVDEKEAAVEESAPISPVPEADTPAGETAPTPTPAAPAPMPSAPSALLTRGRASGFGPRIPNIGRADTANRFNLFDNMGTAPTTRVFFGFQHLQTQNNSVFVTGQNERLFNTLGTAAGRAAFISFTGFGSGLGTAGGGGDVVVDPSDPASAKALEDLYLQHNTGGVTRAYTTSPNTNLYRFGFEYALTLDFSVAMQAQYVTPLDDVEQPEMFSNPLIQLKHVVYRGERSLLSAVAGISPQIPHPELAIVEKTSRLGPGLLGYYALDDEQRWFAQGGTAFSFPTSSGNIKTWDWALGMGFWLYQDESMKPTYDGPESRRWILGIVPQIQVLGKHIIGDNIVSGQFGLNAAAPQTAAGTLNPVDGTRTIYLPQEPSSAVQESAFIYEEPRHVLDMTFGTTLLLRDNYQFMLGVSFPVTGGNARATEFIMTLNRTY